MKGSYIIGVDNKIWNLQFKELDNKIPQHWSSKYRNLKSLSMQFLFADFVDFSTH
jgi:hypothetical protein